MKPFQNTSKAINSSTLQTDWWKVVYYLEAKCRVTTWQGVAED